LAELALTDIVLLTLALLAGLILGWVVRGRRSLGEKAVINSGWREQITAQRDENQRLVEQNKGLLQQNRQYQASEKDSRMRAAELSSALKEVLERRDELQREIEEIRGSLEVAVRERDQLQSDIGHRRKVADDTDAVRQRDERIAALTKELKSWQQRVPPLIEGFRARNQEALELEARLAGARNRIGALESMLGADPASDRPGAPDVEPLPPDAAPQAAGDVGAPAASMAADAYPDSSAGAVAPDSNGRAGAGIDTMAVTADALGRDNLKRIKGIGPAIEKTLNEMGIWRFSQIASMSEYEMDRVAQRLPGFRSRIYREDWMGQAREFEERKASSND
jgi:predicted flap endonuclease-1-like 5' DNA nuclease